MESVRTPFQGVWNIVRFNWPMFAITAGATALAIIIAAFTPPPINWALHLVAIGALTGTTISLAASYLIYDRSPLYQLPWLTTLDISESSTIIINAGFDEISSQLAQSYPNACHHFWDFYDSDKHTEPSILRARNAYPPHPSTIQVETHTLPHLDHSADMICLMMSAHEIRDPKERRTFFSELHRILSPSGTLWITEHLRDTPNFLAYSIGALHFHSHREWLSVFEDTGFHLQSELKTTPFVSTFILTK